MHIYPLIACPLALAVGAGVVALDEGPRVESAYQPVDIKEWTVPWEQSRPRDPFVDGTGRVWFVGQRGNYVAYLVPSADSFVRFEIASGAHPHNLIVDGEGTVWFTGNRNGTIVALDPATRKTRVYPILDSTIRDPHTMVIDDDKIVWFTAQQAGAVVRFDPATGAVRSWRTGANSRPYGIVVGTDGRIWFDLFGTNALGSIDRATLQLTRHPLPNAESRPRRIGLTSDGAVWYTDYTRGMLGRLDPATGVVTEVALPGGKGSLPYAMAVDHRDRVWAAETGVRPNRLVAVDAKTRQIVDTASVGGGPAPNTIRHMVFHAPTRAIWFGTDRNTVGRARLE